MRTHCYQLAIALAVLLLGVHSTIGQEPDSVDRDYANELPRFAPLSPEEAVGSFKLMPGFRMELVAAEPLVTDPIAFAFDARNRLFVVEMRGYSEQPDEGLGKIALLEDRDGDGKMDSRKEFVTGLSWPTGVWPWKDGVLVLEPPTITWYRDLDGNGVSDTSEVWFDGFRRDNVQGMANSFRWGIDGYLYGASSSVGASLKHVKASHVKAGINLRRRDFRIDPVTSTLRASSGGAQHGLSFNRWGDKFLTSNSDHLQQVLDLDSWISQYATGYSFPPLRRSIAADGPQAEVYRSSPVEPWRIVRTRLRVGGIVPGPVEGGGRAAGYFTGATGTLIADRECGYSSNPEFDTALVCDVGSNLVHRKHLYDEGLYWKGVRVDDAAELLSSSDTWFRPVQLGSGPDGCVYIADMYREIIEHPKSLHSVIKRHLDLTSGRDRGRIWRLISEASKLEMPTTPPHDLKEKDLAHEMLSPIRWRRNTAAQLLLERSSDSNRRQGVETAMRELVTSMSEASPECQIQIAYLAARLGQLPADVLRQMLEHSSHRVVEHALHLIRIQHLSSEFVESLKTLTAASSLRVQLAVVLNAVALEQRERLEILRRIMPRVSDDYVRSAFAVSAGRDLQQLISTCEQELVRQGKLGKWVSKGARRWAEQIASEQIRNWLLRKITSSDVNVRNIYMTALGQDPDLAIRLVQLLRRDVKVELSEWLLTELRKSQPSSGLLPWIVCLNEDERIEVVTAGLRPEQPPQYQSAVIELAGNSARLSEIVVQAFDGLSPTVQSSTIQFWLNSFAGQQRVLAAVEEGRITLSQLSTQARSRLRESRIPEIAANAQRLLGEVSPDRRALVESYSRALPEDWGSVSREKGKQHFARLCAQCHRLDSVGVQVGAGLKDLQQKSPEQLLIAILDPNREVDPRFASITILREDGQVLAGLVSDESSAEIELSLSGGKRQRILRSEIEQLQSRGKSLMPEGIEQQISPEQMAELIKFLRSSP